MSTDPEIIYDEALVPPYELPELLAGVDAGSWRRRRAELLALFEDRMYGRMPGRPKQQTASVFEESDGALAGTATRRQVRIDFGGGRGMDLLLYLPNQRPGPVPVFLGLNFKGNHGIQTDPAIRVSTDEARGVAAGRWAAARIIERGYGLATVWYGHLDPDFDDGFANGVHPLFDPPGERPGHAWGAIGAWAWGLSRALDYLETVPEVNAGRVAVMGHSRLGKTALWAGACDERFALVISNNSGCGGAALSRRCYGETLAVINRAFPHWFCRNFHGYSGREAELPFDQHQLLALMAPRPVYVASAEDDRWADPRGEFLSAYHAGPAYALLGKEPLPGPGMPGVHRPLVHDVGYHLRAGGHGVTDYDWERFMDFADRHLWQ